jgi:glycosyltransferase involved in cell wall biosynthesis
MRVLIVLTYYWPHRTGLTLHVQYLAEALVERGHEVTVLTSRFLDSLPRDQVLNGVRVVRLRPVKRISRGQVVPGFPLAAYRLLREHDVVSLHSPLLEAPLVALLARRMGKGCVITHHGDLVLPSGLLNRFIEWTVLRLFKVAAQAADHIIAYSDDYAEHSRYVAPFMAKTTALYPPILIPEPTTEGRAQVRRSLGLDTEAAIGYAGRFVEEKRPDILLRALRYLNDALPSPHILFAGDYIMPYEKFYQRCLPMLDRYQHQVHFLGLIRDDREMANFYAACDVLVLPSSTECFGLVQVESMLCGTPVVATDIPGAREPVRVTGMGEIVRPRDTLALAKAIARVVQERQRYVKPREEIERLFSFERTIQGYEEILAGAVGTPRPSASS